MVSGGEEEGVIRGGSYWRCKNFKTKVTLLNKKRLF